MPQVITKQELRSLDRIQVKNLSVDPLRDFSSLIYAEANRRNRVVKLTKYHDIALEAKHMRSFNIEQERAAKDLTSRDRELKAYQILIRDHFTIDKWMPPVESIVNNGSNTARAMTEQDDEDRDTYRRGAVSNRTPRSPSKQFQANVKNDNSKASMAGGVSLPTIGVPTSTEATTEEKMIDGMRRKVLRGGFDMRFFRRFLDTCMNDESEKAKSRRIREERIHAMSERAQNMSEALETARRDESDLSENHLSNLLKKAVIKPKVRRQREKTFAAPSSNLFSEDRDQTLLSYGGTSSNGFGTNKPNLTMISEPTVLPSARLKSSGKDKFKREGTVYFSPMNKPIISNR